MRLKFNGKNGLHDYRLHVTHCTLKYYFLLLTTSPRSAVRHSVTTAMLLPMKSVLLKSDSSSFILFQERKLWNFGVLIATSQLCLLNSRWNNRKSYPFLIQLKNFLCLFLFNCCIRYIIIPHKIWMMTSVAICRLHN